MNLSIIYLFIYFLLTTQVVAHDTDSWINKEDDESYDTGTTIMTGM